MKEHTESCEETEISSHSNNGLADVMNKILKTSKPKRKKTIVLAKAKKLSTKLPITSSKDNCGADDLLQNGQVKNSEWTLKGRIKPNPLERNNEKRLLKITVSGVVNLFNAVNQYKRNSSISDPVMKKGRLNLIDKNKFLDILSSGSAPLEKNNKEVQMDIESKEDEYSETWNVLRKDFVNNTKWRNWDKALIDQN